MLQTNIYTSGGQTGSLHSRTSIPSSSLVLHVCAARSTLSLTWAYSLPKESIFSPPATRTTTRTTRRSSRSGSSLWCRTAPGACLQRWTSWRPRWEAWHSLRLSWAPLLHAVLRYTDKKDKHKCSIRTQSTYDCIGFLHVTHFLCFFKTHPSSPFRREVR